MNNKNTGLPRPNKRRVKLSTLGTDENALQPRFGELRENHVADLSDVVRRGHELDPMSVWENPDTGDLVVADGHHRLEAYRRVKPDAKVEVRVFKCDKHTAQMIPMADNAKTRLSLSHDEKANWAWRIDEERRLSKREVVQLCGISDRLVGYQRQVRKQLNEDGECLPDTWKEALRISQGKDRGEWTEKQRDEAMKAEVAKADEAFGSSLAALIARWPEAAATLIERCAGNNRLERIADYLGWVHVTGETEEEIGLLGMRLGETFSEEQVERIAVIAKEGPAF